MSQNYPMAFGKIIIGCLLFFIIMVNAALAQQATIQGKVLANEKPAPFASIAIDTTHGTTTDSLGFYSISLAPGSYKLQASFTGMAIYMHHITLKAGQTQTLNIKLEETATTLDEVVVTGVAGSSKIKNTPVAIAVVSKKVLQAGATSNIIDALVKAIPGVTAVTTGPNISKPFIRGLGYSRVLTMYDGVRQEGQQWGDEHGIEVDQYGITRAEVVKGPASLSYGSDAVAGAVNLLPLMPAENGGKMIGDALVEYQTNNRLVGGSVGLSQKIKSFMWAIRSSGKTAIDYKNPVDGRVYATGFKEVNFSGMIGIEKAAYKTYIYASAYDNLQEIPDGSRDSLTRNFTWQQLEADHDNIKNRLPATHSQLTSYNIVPLHQHIQHYRIYNKTTLKTKLGELNTLLGFQQNRRQEFNHPTVPKQAGLDVQLNTINYEVKLNFNQWQGVYLTMGINGMQQTNTHKNATDFPIPDYNLFDIGVFLLAKKDVGKFSISGGIRYDNRSVKWDDFYTRTNPLTGFKSQVKNNDTVGAQMRFGANKQSFTGVSASAGFTYTFSNEWYLKANIARGYRAPNITETGANGLDPGAHIYYIGNNAFKPEFNWQQDLGVFYAGKDVSGSVEIFNNHISNYIFLQKVLDENGAPLELVPGNNTYQYKQASALLYGLEALVSLHPQTFKWLSFTNSMAIITGLNKDKTLLKEFGRDAKYLPLIPPFHTLSNMRFELPESSKTFTGIYVQAEFEHYGAKNNFYAVDNTETATPAYNLVNASSGFNIKNKAGIAFCRLYMSVNNFFNKAYQSNMNRLKYFEYYQQSPNGKSGIYNMGRNVCIKTIFSF